MENSGIKSVSEAFSMQPNAWFVSQKYKDETSIKEFRHTTRQVSSDKQVNYIVAYGFNNEILHELIAESVNVHYV